MSWNILLIIDNNKRIETDKDDTEKIMNNTKQTAINLLQSLGKAMDERTIKLDETTYIEYSLDVDREGRVEAIHFDIGGKRQLIKTFLKSVAIHYGHQWHDVSNGDFFTLEDLDKEWQ